MKDAPESDADRPSVVGVHPVAFAARWLLTFAVLAGAVDLASIRAGAATLPGGSVARALSVSFAWAVLLGGGAAALLSIVAAVANRLPIAARTRAWLAGAWIGLTVAGPMWAGGLALLAGRGISDKSWIGVARAIFSGMCWVGITLTFATSARWRRERLDLGSWNDWRTRRFMRLATVPAGLACVAADWVVYPQLYAVAHVLLWLAVLLLAGGWHLLAAVVTPPAKGRRVVVAAALAILGAGVVVGFDPLSADASARAAAFRHTRFLRRVLPYVRSAPVDVARPVDPAVMDALRSGARLDDATLDRAIPARRKLNLVFLSIDALRPDRLRRNGCLRLLAPNLEALMARGTYFRSAWTTYPYTMFAFSSLFRGCYASGTDAYPEILRPGTVFPGTRKATLGGELGKAGWRSEAVVGFPPFVRHYFQREHEGFAAVNRGGGQKLSGRALVAEEVTSLALDVLDQEPEKPLFIWVHYFDPHAPYDPPGERPFGTTPPDLYDTEIYYTDREIGRLVDGLKVRGRLADTAFFILSDHGEDLKEFDHGTALTEEQIHVPVAIVIPGLAAREVGSPIDLSALMPTALQLVGLPTPPGVHGRSILPYVLLGDPSGAPGAAFPPPLAFVELGAANVPGPPPQFAVRDRDRKLVFHADANTFSLFDLDADPLERHDLSTEQPQELERLQRILGAFQAMTR